MPAPPPWSLPFDFGLVLLAAPLAWPVVRRWPAERRRLILLWIGLGLLLMYAPVAYQRRFAFGVQPAIAVLAGVGLVELNAWMRVSRIGGVRRRVINYGVLLAAVSTSLLVYLSLLGSALLNRPAEVYLWSRPESTAATWLGQHSAVTDVVLASTEYANPMVGAIDGRVVHGHIVATLHSPLKEAQVHRFFSADASPAERTQLLKDTQATFVAFGPQERIMGATDVSTTPGLALVYDADGVQLFRVQS
jgi:asparagine N-glycosylation enzyme membrane subunit Stt3